MKTILLAIVGLALLMIVHEAGHFFVARIFKMKVLKFSIGFGPVLWSKKPEGSTTTYQIALLPMVAYVQIAGMNPFEESDPDDKTSYANASWLGRTLTIFAGPAANYLLAVVATFFLLLAVGKSVGVDGLKIGEVREGYSAKIAGVQVDDEVQSINGQPMHDWVQMRETIQSNKGKPIELVVLRNGNPVPLKVTPSADKGAIGIGAKELRQKVGVAEASKAALIEPPKMAYRMIEGFGRLLTRKEKLEVKGPVGIVQEAGSQFQQGFESGISFLAILSIYLCVFNLLPFPALDGGRLAFLLYEFIARRKPDAKVEARVHMIGMLALLTLFIPLFFMEIWQSIAKFFVKG